MSINWLELQSLRPYFTDYDKVDKNLSVEKSEKVHEINHENKSKNNRPIKNLNKKKLKSAYEELNDKSHDDLLVSMVMTKKVECIELEDSFETLREKFLAFDFRQFPVLSNGKVCGMICDDTLFRMYLKGADTSKIKLDSLVTNKFLTIFESSSISQVALVMLREGLNAVPIINEQIELCGIVTFSDLVHAIFCHKMLDLRV